MTQDEISKKLYEIHRADDTEALQQMLDAGLDVNFTDSSLDTAIHEAARFGAAKCLTVLLNAGADITLRNENKETALHKAAKCWRIFRHLNSQSATCVDLLLKAGADPSAKAESWIGTPLDVAVDEKNHPETCLLRQAVAPEKQPIIQAVWDADTEALKSILTQQPGKLGRMLGKKSEVNVADEFGYTPLHIATLPGRRACLPLLLEAGAKPNAITREGITPLMMSTLMADAESMQLLIKAGASTEIADDYLNTPLIKAVDYGYLDCAKTLLKAGANINHRNKRKYTALQESIGNPEIMAVLIQAGAKLNAADETGMTPLANCAHSSDIEKNLACMRLLIDAGADINRQECRGIPPIYWTCCHSGIGLLRMLIDAGANVNLSDQSGMTPLHCAAMDKNPEAIRLLLAAGADPAAKDAAGKTPRDYAKGREGQEARDILAEALRARGISLTHGPVMPVKEIRRKLRRKAIIFKSSAAEQHAPNFSSYLGKVAWQRPDETWPTDAEGNMLEPLATIFLKDLPALPTALKKVELITIFAPQDAWTRDSDEHPRLGCMIRTYSTTEGLTPCNYTAKSLTPCLLTPELVKNDMPNAPTCGGTDELWDHIDETERALEVDYREDIQEEEYETHKIGVYPTYAQYPPELPGGYNFVLQISSDDTAGLEIGDSGNYYFYYNSRKKDWLVHADCY